FSELAQGRAPSSAVVLAVDLCFLVVFFVMTYAFGFASKLLFVFLLDIDVLYVFRIVRELTHTTLLNLPIAVAVVVLMGIALYIAFGLVLANAAGRALLPIAGPLFRARALEAPVAQAPRPDLSAARHGYGPADDTQRIPFSRPISASPN